jgi:hypothetical protein
MAAQPTSRQHIPAQRPTFQAGGGDVRSEQLRARYIRRRARISSAALAGRQCRSVRRIKSKFFQAREFWRLGTGRVGGRIAHRGDEISVWAALQGRVDSDRAGGHHDPQGAAKTVAYKVCIDIVVDEDGSARLVN